MLRYSILAAGLLLAGQVAAQNELPSTPQPGNLPGPATRPAPAAPTPVFAPERTSLYSRSTLGIDLGWGAPYGWGISYAYLVGPGTDVTAGLGIGVGGKIGIGVRHYLAPLHKLSPYFGLNLARTGRVDEVTLTLDEGLPTEETVTYVQPPSGVLHLRSGLRWQPGRVGLLGTLGYGVRLSGDPATYAAPGSTPSPRMRQLMRIIGPGGLEVSLGMAIALSPR
ncbi:hypothetical protein [Hymenobacter weizhouensis]|uniref:hypothetical protein n=1 Tax=Hymenobacter sp. YIM 151500-1 TaxID=2987689 RepID=UPI0022268A21|nr:hypothetical protein [Hymenobacter sp. YIM 151500-1]UYZ65079.1 hypothetical protein OIS53_09545 [Hymenobacter sp. YIM 151500-1]